MRAVWRSAGPVLRRIAVVVVVAATAAALTWWVRVPPEEAAMSALEQTAAVLGTPALARDANVASGTAGSGTLPPLHLTTRKEVLLYVHGGNALTTGCASELRVGGNGDGGKWVCAPAALLRAEGPRCLVYSFGSRLSFEFEDAVHALAPQCEIHVFDPTPSLAVTMQRTPEVVPRHVTFHSLGLCGPGAVLEIQGQRVEARTLDAIMAELGHTDRPIALLKMDIDSSENAPGLVPTRADAPTSVWHAGRVGQLLVEVHPIELLGSDPVGLIPYRRFMAAVAATGLRLFHTEANMFASYCAEHALLDPSYRLPDGRTLGDLAAVPYTRDQHRANLRDGLEASRVFRDGPPSDFRTMMPFLFDRFEALYHCQHTVLLGSLDRGGAFVCTDSAEAVPTGSPTHLLAIYDRRTVPVRGHCVAVAAGCAAHRRRGMMLSFFLGGVAGSRGYCGRVAGAGVGRGDAHARIRRRRAPHGRGGSGALAGPGACHSGAHGVGVCADGCLCPGDGGVRLGRHPGGCSSVARGDGHFA
jgi:hypothetical protein